MLPIPQLTFSNFHSSSSSQTTNASADDPTFARALRKTDKTLTRQDMKTFVFSATLSKDLQGNLKRGNWRRNKKNVKSNTLDDLFGKLDFRDDKPEVIDISPEGRLVASLRESMVECMLNEKVGITEDGTAQYFLAVWTDQTLCF